VVLLSLRLYFVPFWGWIQACCTSLSHDLYASVMLSQSSFYLLKAMPLYVLMIFTASPTGVKLIVCCLLKPVACTSLISLSCLIKETRLSFCLERVGVLPRLRSHTLTLLIRRVMVCGACLCSGSVAGLNLWSASGKGCLCC